MYFNMRIVTRAGDEVPFRDAVFNFVKSPAFQDFKANVGQLWDHGWEHGFWSTFQSLIDSLDPTGEKNALKVLELKSGATQEEIRAKYRELSKKWHPDKYKAEDEKAKASEM
jgi:DnaJ family protein C protein 22